MRVAQKLVLIAQICMTASKIIDTKSRQDRPLKFNISMMAYRPVEIALQETLLH